MDALKQFTKVKETENYTMYQEQKGYDWFIDYLVYEDKVQAIEYMNGIQHHAEYIGETVEEVLKVTSLWC
jgi:hypothetical protein